MTGLYNHSSFKAHIEELIKNFDSKKPLCLAIIDVDDFKNINDTYSQNYGDIVLTYLAETLKKHCTKDDTAYRYGGEEFAILFIDKNIKQALTISRNILDEFRKHNFEFTNKPITFSVGIAENSKGIASSDFFENADKTLYRAKKEGKNRVLAEKL